MAVTSVGLKEVGAMAGCSLRTEEPWRQREDEEAEGRGQRSQGEVTPSLGPVTEQKIVHTGSGALGD